MRLVIDLDEKYLDVFCEALKGTDATIAEIDDEPDFLTELPEHVKAGIEKSLEQVKNGQTKSYEEVKKILADRSVK